MGCCSRKISIIFGNSPEKGSPVSWRDTLKESSKALKEGLVNPRRDQKVALKDWSNRSLPRKYTSTSSGHSARCRLKQFILRCKTKRASSNDDDFGRL
jgi:hypothetical protein